MCGNYLATTLCKWICVFCPHMYVFCFLCKGVCVFYEIMNRCLLVFRGLWFVCSRLGFRLVSNRARFPPLRFGKWVFVFVFVCMCVFECFVQGCVMKRHSHWASTIWIR